MIDYYNYALLGHLAQWKLV